MYPIMAKLAGRKVVVVGAGRIGTRKIKTLVTANADVLVISPEGTEDVETLAASGAIIWKRRGFRRRDLRGAWLAIAATNVPSVNARVYTVAERARCMVNSVDDPDHCTFYVPASIERGDLLITVSTSGSAPYLSRRLKQHLDGLIPDGFGDALAAIAEQRRRILDDAPEDEAERARLVREGIERAIDRALGEIPS